MTTPEENDWGDTSNIGETWGEPSQYNIEGAWNIEEENDILIGDKYIFLTDSREYPFLCTVLSINNENQILELTDDDEKIILVNIDKNNNIISKTEEYSILEYIKVIEFDYDLENYKKGITQVDFEVLLKDDIEKVYSKTMIADDLLTELIKSYGCYDNYHKIKRIHEITDLFLFMIDNVNKETIKKPNHWLIPIINNNTKLFIDENSCSLTDIEDNGDTSYENIIKNQIKNSESFEYKEGNGYNTSEYIGNVLRECSITKSCSGINGDYDYDERKTRKFIKIPKEKFTESKEIITEILTLFQSDSINIIGYLEEPINKLYHQNIDNLLSDFNLNQQIIYDNLLSLRTNKLQDKVILNYLSLEDSIKPELNNNFTFYNFDEKLTYEKLNKILDTNTKNYSDIIKNLLIDDTINTKILNYNDIKEILFKYNINYSDLELSDRKKIDTLIQDNINEYEHEYKKLHKREFKIIKTKKKELTNEKRVSLSYDYIFSILSENRKNELLKDFIDKFTRTADKPTEDNNSLYNKYNDKKILCKHYLYSVEINNSNNIFHNMKTIFGSSPLDGKIYCKYCNEYLCDEDFSTLEGFSDDKPIQSNETITNIKETEIIKDKLDTKQELVSLITMISNIFGVTLNDRDIYEIIISYDNINHNILADNRYNMVGVSNTDIHPKVKEQLKENKKAEKVEKDKKKKDKLKKKRSEIMGNFQNWIKDTNKLLLITSFICLFIQTALPTYETRKNIEINVIDINGKINNSTINFVCSKIKSLSKKYSEDKLFKNSKDLIEDKDIEKLDEQIKRTLLYINSPNFPIIIEKLNKHSLFLKTITDKYIRDEWTNFKPLSSSSLVNKNKETIKENITINEKYLLRLYRGLLIENISLIRPLNEDILICDILKIDSLKIIQNSSFKKLFRYIISCYGNHENNVLINLISENLLETTDKKEEVLEIFKKCNWNESSNSFRVLDFHKLRTELIPSIFKLFTNNDHEIEPCFNKDKCNEYIHTSVNTYDLHLLNTRPKRIYNYDPYDAYVNLKIADMNKDHIDKIFTKYRLDDNGEIVINYSNKSYLDKYIVKTVPIEPELIDGKQGKELVKNDENYKLLLSLKSKLSKKKYIPVYPIHNNYDEEYYDNILQLSRTDVRLLKYLNYKIETISDNTERLLSKLPNALSSDSENISYNDIYSVHYKVLEKYTNGLFEKKNPISLKSFEQIFSEYIKMYNYDLSRISYFLSESKYITKDQKSRFEKVFTKSKIKFSKENINQILTLFIDSSIDYEDIISYIKNIQYIFIKINKSDIPQKGNYMPNKIPKEWKLTDSVSNNFMGFIDREINDENINSSLLLHNSIFTKFKSDYYLGFNHYKTLSKNYHIYIRNLYNYISDDFENLDMFKGDRNSLFDEKLSTIYSKHHIIKILTKMVEYIEGLQLEKTEIINDAIELYKLLEERTEDLLEENIHICSLFLMDLLTNMLLTHYDLNWLYMNKNKNKLSDRLSKQNEREKQERVDKIHSASREDRLLMKYQQENGQSNWWKEASEGAQKFVNSDEYSSLSETERIERLQELFTDENVTFEEIDVNKLNIPQIVPEGQEEQNEEEEYYGEQLNEENEEYLDDYDEEQEMVFNE